MGRFSKILSSKAANKADLETENTPNLAAPDGSNPHGGDISLTPEKS
jgi:hypothetical protein